ncbi:MAG: phenylalanine--tRNA ligase subunit beta [Steroidobacteraceae bacterium]
MRVPLDWLREWVEIGLPAADLGARLSMIGFELEALDLAAPAFTGVVVAQITNTANHPNADKLKICEVDSGDGSALHIVCGAANARAGLKVALARVGAQLPGGVQIKSAKLRGSPSEGMLCSPRELGLGDKPDGIIELDAEAPLGMDLRQFLGLDESILELAITPNRGDAMSVLGVAREVAAMLDATLRGPSLGKIRPTSDERLDIRLSVPEAAPRFVGRLFRGLDNSRPSPGWLRERLRRAGLRSVSPIVDVTNYVLLELGQPMHAYDRRKLTGGVDVRMARAGEKLELLNGQTVELAADMTVIADQAGAVGLAGIMGGARTAVSSSTTDVLIEVAYFSPQAIAGRGRRLGLVTDASQRFERGVDPTGQERAIERASGLLLAIAGGECGPVLCAESIEHLPRRPAVPLRRSRLRRLLGAEIDDRDVTRILAALGMQVVESGDGWQVAPPAHRFDVTIEADLIEECARLRGYERIAEEARLAPQVFARVPEDRPGESAILQALAARGYHECVTYAFVDSTRQSDLFPDGNPIRLVNPIASDLDVMRGSLWPGLLTTALSNLRRQIASIRLFEKGITFKRDNSGGVIETETLALLLTGPRHDERWDLGTDRAVADFFDIKAEYEWLAQQSGELDSFSIEPAGLACLHPHRSARILRAGAEIGWIGELHPNVAVSTEFTHPVLLLEVDFDAMTRSVLPKFTAVSRYPQVRRDLAVVVDETTPMSKLREGVISASSSLLRDLRVFDIYRGPGIEKGRKSVAFGLIFQDNSRTLTDEDVDAAIAAIRHELCAKFGAKIRE